MSADTLIADCMADIVARIKSVAEMSGPVDITLGGKANDPALTKVPLPFAWPSYAQDTVDEDPYTTSSSRGPGMVPASQMVLANVRVIIGVAYTNQADMLANQYPLLLKVAKAIKGSGKPAPSGHRWRYLGQKLAWAANDRMLYEQHYTLDMVL